jgi:hypothetical protein
MVPEEKSEDESDFTKPFDQNLKDNSVMPLSSQQNENE